MLRVIPIESPAYDDVQATIKSLDPSGTHRRLKSPCQSGLSSRNREIRDPKQS